MLVALSYFETWAKLPFHFWSVVLFVFGCMLGSFLNVCIHRLPLDQSIVWPPSHCPHCRYSIPWYLNIPLATWLYLRGKCRNCGAPISIRYFLVELLTGVEFLVCWLVFGPDSAKLAVIYGFFLAGLMVATFIDFEHFIIPDEITYGGMVVGFVCSLLVPSLHGKDLSTGAALLQSAVGMAVGGGVVYAIVRLGKLLFGRQRLALPPGTRVVFTETSLLLPGEEIPYEDVLYRQSDAIVLHAQVLELADRCYRDVPVRLSQTRLNIGSQELDPEAEPHMEAVASEIILPREAMGLGDVKLMAAIGAFLGWQAVLFSLMASSLIGSLAGLTLILLGKQAWSARIPYGPYIALGAVLWLFCGQALVHWWFGG